MVWVLSVWVWGLGLLGFVVRRRLAGFWVLQSVWLVSSWIGAAPAGPGPLPWLGEAVLRPKAARLAFVVVVCVGLFVRGFWVGLGCLSLCGFAPDRKKII